VCVACTHVCLHLFSAGLSPNLLGIYYKLQQIAWSMYCSCSSTARTCVSEHVVKRSLILYGFSPNLLRTYYELPQVAWAMYLSCLSTIRACQCLRVLSFLNGFSPNYLRTYYELPQAAWAAVLLFTHCTRVCERACESTRVVKRLLIFGRILSKLC
jgi:hypothetical protein